MIDRSTILRVMDAVDIVDVVREFVTLRKAGVNYKGLCPFHNEKTPSFVVSPAKQLCKCFSCGKGGDAVHFLMNMEQLTYPEAIKWLGRKYGIEVRDKEQTDEEKAAQTVRESMFVVNEWARDYFEDILHNNVDGVAVGMAYFRKRGLRDDIIRRFQLGYSPEERDALARTALSKGYSREFLTKTGLCFETEDHRLLDRYHGRVIFPVHSVSGKVVAFGGRILSSDKKLAKYVNSPESEIYSKSRELYGLYLAKKAIVKENRCFMVEGYMDVISMHQSGVENVVASSGTSLTEGQIRLLHRFTNNITVLYDGDAAGIHASLRGIDMLLEEGMNIKVLLLPDGDDPDSFSRKHSSEDFKRYIDEHQVDFINFKTGLLMQDVGDDPIKKAGLVKDIVRSISVIPDGLVRQTYAHECATLMQMSEQLILSEVAKMRRESAEKTVRKEERAEEEAAALQETGAQGRGDLLLRQPEALQEERLLVQQVIRYGECLIADGTEEEGGRAFSVASFIASDLEADALEFTLPLHRQVLQEALAHEGESDFRALPYFLHHPDAEVSRLAAELGTDVEPLSSKQREMYGNELERLGETVPRLLNDFKFSVVNRERKSLEQEIKAKAASGDKTACLALMKRYKELGELFALISKATGEKVVVKK